MSRRFFSGRSLQAAVLSAAAKFNLDPDELAYEEIDKRHGLLKSRGKVVIAVDPNEPRKGAGGAGPAEGAVAQPAEEPKAERAAAPSRRRGAPAGEEPEREEEAAAAAVAEPAEEEEPAKRPSRRRRRAAPEAEAEAAEEEEEAESEEPAAAAEKAEATEEEPARPRRGRGRGRGRREEPSVEAEEPRRARSARADREEEPVPEKAEEAEPARPRRDREASREDRDERKGRAARGAEREEREGLVELPDRPRALADRYPRARGPLAKAAKQSIDAIAAVAALEVEAEVFEGEDRLEIDLSGPHHALLVAEDGELLVAIEHLLPRVMRGFGGETAAVRVDCENFQEIREERLRSYAQVVAGEVRRTGRARNLDPLSPSDRRIVHLTVADEPGVESESEGSGYLKRVRVSPA